MIEKNWDCEVTILTMSRSAPDKSYLLVRREVLDQVLFESCEFITLSVISPLLIIASLVVAVTDTSVLLLSSILVGGNTQAFSKCILNVGCKERD